LFAGVITSAQAAPSSPTTNTESVKQIEEVVRVFQTYLIKKDAIALSALFLPEHNSWLTVMSDDQYRSVKAKHPEVHKVMPSTYQDFVEFVRSTPKPVEEKFSNVHIDTNGKIGAVYFDFVFLVDGVLNNQGSESWHLVKTEEGWKISSMVYSSGN
jgi:hypothetical protein